eukprot:TRINITY_DN4057_c0_g1_i1.p1 TRINITY_DN4057_c0_g1~~TRINITY_DN4057_c0_g1_i1.p1  ORF type:complete len:350 (-),score=60.82 TRINITY_DN4057_c0_g1_i1:201-1250(-)
MPLASSRVLLAAAAVGASAMMLQKPQQNSNLLGSPQCPCVGVKGREGFVEQRINRSLKLSVVVPEEYGAECRKWDDDNYPGCKDGQDPGKGKEWCAQAWCYVDPCNCNLTTAPVQSTSFHASKVQGKPLYYSYDTCGGKDSYSVENNHISCVAQTAKATCEALKADGKPKCAWSGSECVKKELLETCTTPADENVWGNKDCPCIGISNRTGFSNAHAGNRTVDYPPGVGSYCKAWEQGVDYPGCEGSNPPSWCSTKWCYVDPCKCKMKDDPVLSFSFPKAKYQGKYLFYSYSTCGGSDSWTASNNNVACVNRKDKASCAKLKKDDGSKKCAWTGDACKGKDIVDSCGSE